MSNASLSSCLSQDSGETTSGTLQDLNDDKLAGLIIWGKSQNGLKVFPAEASKTYRTVGSLAVDHKTNTEQANKESE